MTAATPATSEAGSLLRGICWGLAVCLPAWAGGLWLAWLVLGGGR